MIKKLCTRLNEREAAMRILLQAAVNSRYDTYMIIVMILAVIFTIYSMRAVSFGMLVNSLGSGKSYSRKQARALRKQAGFWQKVTMSYIKPHVRDDLKGEYKVLCIVRAAYDAWLALCLVALLLLATVLKGAAYAERACDMIGIVNFALFIIIVLLYNERYYFK